MAPSHTPTRDGRRIEDPLGGVPPPKVFGVRRVAIRKGVWKKKALKDLSFPEGVRTDFLLGFVLGRFLDSRLLSSASSWIFLAKLAEDLTKNHENHVKSGGVWGGVAPQQEQPKTCPK